MVDLSVRPLRNKQAPRKVFLFHEADSEKLHDEAKKFADSFTNTKCTDNSNKTVEEMWQCFKSEQEHIVNKHVPVRNKSSHWKLPWVTRDVKSILNKRDKAYVKMKKSNTSSNRQHFKALKKLGQQKLRQAY